MKRYLSFFLLSLVLLSCEDQKKEIYIKNSYNSIRKTLAKSVGLEIINYSDTIYLKGEKKLGFTYINGKIRSSENKNIEYLLFLGLKKEYTLNKKYSLVFAVKEKKEQFIVREVFENISLTLMHNLENDLDLNSFQTLEEKLSNEFEPEMLLLDIKYSWVSPILISNEQDVSILVYYNNIWFVKSLKNEI